MDELIQNLKVQIIEALNLEDMDPSEIDENEPLFVEGLGLDSIDALELVVLLEKEYGIKIDNMAEGKNILRTVKSMAEFIRENQKS
jgi:acyl carrier protein